MLGSPFFSPTGLLEEFDRLQKQMDSLLGTTWPGLTNIRAGRAGGFPAVNVGATPEEIDVYLFAPGMEPDQFDISIEQNVLTISGERNDPPPENARQYLQERFNGKFSRVITLPDDVDPERVDANYRNGVLHIRLNRQEATRPHRIEVKA